MQPISNHGGLIDDQQVSARQDRSPCEGKDVIPLAIRLLRGLEFQTIKRIDSGVDCCGSQAGSLAQHSRSSSGRRQESNRAMCVVRECDQPLDHAGLACTRAALEDEALVR
jgi:hypothetical protein